MGMGDWIPQVFYDLIGRIAPATFLLAVGCLLFFDPVRANGLRVLLFSEPGVPLTVLLACGLVATYTIGALLGAVGFAFANHEWTATRLKTLRVEFPIADKPGTGVSFMYDAVVLCAPTAGARLVKLRAEQHMCRVLMAGVVVLLLLYCPSHWPPWAAGKDIGALGALAFIGSSSYLFYVHLAIRARCLLLNHWYLLGEPTRVSGTDAVANKALHPTAADPDAAGRG